MIEEALYQLLTGNQDILQFFGTRIYPGVAVERPTYPFATYQRTGRTSVHLMQRDSPLAAHAFQFTAWGRSYTESRDGGKRLLAALQDVSGTYANITIQRIFIDDILTTFDGTSQAFGHIVEATVWASAS